MSDVDAKVAEFAGLTLDQIEEQPGYRTPNPCKVKVQLDFEIKVAGKKEGAEPALFANAKVLEVLEMKNEEDEKPLVGDMFGTMYSKQAMGYQQVRKVINKYCEIAGLPAGQFAGLVGQSLVVNLTTGLRADKNDKEKFYVDFLAVEAA